MRLQRMLYNECKNIFADKMTHITIDIHCSDEEHITAYVWNTHTKIVAMTPPRNILNKSYKQVVKLLVERLVQNAKEQNEATKSTS